MSARHDFGDLMRQTVTVERYIGPSHYGDDAVYATPVELPARIEFNNRRVLSIDNVEVTSTTTIFVSPDVEIGPSDRFTLSDGRRPVIIAVEKDADEFGEIYYQAALAQ